MRSVIGILLVAGICLTGGCVSKLTTKQNAASDARCQHGLASGVSVENPLSQTVPRKADVAAVQLLPHSIGTPTEFPIISYQGPGGERLGFYVSSKMFQRTPEWVFDGKTTPPLSFLEAYQKAQKSIRKRYPKVNSFQLRSYALQHCGFSNAPNRWYYTFEFIQLIDGEEIFGEHYMAMVLLDGSAIEPR